MIWFRKIFFIILALSYLINGKSFAGHESDLRFWEDYTNEKLFMREIIYGTKPINKIIIRKLETKKQKTVTDTIMIEGLRDELCDDFKDSYVPWLSDLFCFCLSEDDETCEYLVSLVGEDRNIEIQLSPKNIRFDACYDRYMPIDNLFYSSIIKLF